MTAKKTASWFDRLSTPVKALTGIVAAMAVILGAAFTVDERYARAGDLRQLTVQMELNQLEARSVTLKDRVFDLQQKKRTPADQASLSRYEQEQRDIDRQISQKRQLLDQMKAGR